jgi:hypothetical protein
VQEVFPHASYRQLGGRGPDDTGLQPGGKGQGGCTQGVGRHGKHGGLILPDEEIPQLGLGQHSRRRPALEY